MQSAAGPGRGPRAGAGPPRHQAGEHPAGERRRAGARSPTSAWPAPSTTRSLTQTRRRRRHAAVHGPRAGAGRGGRPPRRPVQPGQRAVRACAPAGRRSGPATPLAVLRRVCEDDAAADPRGQPRRPRLAGRGRRAAARQGPRRPLRVGRRGGRATCATTWSTPTGPARCRGRSGVGAGWPPLSSVRSSSAASC